MSGWNNSFLMLLFRLLANLMLPDGAEKQLEDWTIFFLNQTPFNTIAPVLALEKPDSNERHFDETMDRPELLYVLNLVRTKHDKSVRRYALMLSGRCRTCYLNRSIQRSRGQSYGYMHQTSVHSNIQASPTHGARRLL